VKFYAVLFAALPNWKNIRFRAPSFPGGEKTGCAGVFVGAECRICADKQKERYMFHRNTLDDKGYRSFLTDFADTALAAFAHVSAAERAVEHASERTVGRAVERVPFAPKNGAVPECLPLTIFDYGCGRGRLFVALL